MRHRITKPEGARHLVAAPSVEIDPGAKVSSWVELYFLGAGCSVSLVALGVLVSPAVVDFSLGAGADWSCGCAGFWTLTPPPTPTAHRQPLMQTMSARAQKVRIADLTPRTVLFVVTLFSILRGDVERNRC